MSLKEEHATSGKAKAAPSLHHQWPSEEALLSKLKPMDAN
jgi:hypothetical protein